MEIQEKSFEYYDAIKPKKVEWLWYPYIPYGKLSLLQGDPGEGKSTFILQLIAILTNGGVLPDESANAEKQTVIYQCAEDSKEDTIKPRLLSAGADCTKVIFIPEKDQPLTLSDNRLEKAIIEAGARLLVLDPIQAFIPKESDMQNASSMRGLMQNLADMAERNKCAIVLVGHMNKATGGKKLYRGLGSIDIAAIARSILMISRDPDAPEIRYMYPIKSSLAYEGCAIGFVLGADTGFKWIGKCDFDPSTEEVNDSLPTKRNQAKEYLKVILSMGDLPSSEVLERMKALGISNRTARTAQKDLEITAYKQGSTWYWHMENR